MSAIGKSLALGFGQLFDGAVLRVLLKSLAVTLIVFLIVATVGWYVLDWALLSGGMEDEAFAGAGAMREALALIMAIIGLWLVWRVVAMAVVQFFADEVVIAVERKHYPQEASMARELGFGEQAGNALRAAGRTLLFNLLAAPIAIILLFTGIGTFAVFWFVNAVLIGRELQDMVWLRHQQDRAEIAPLGKADRFLLGGTIAGLLAMPFANLFAPVLGAASATHLVHRTRNAQRAI
ncbi:EI24 domain-containing protein [Aurantiacibacter sp. D1-12]|uniref:EI24 domain-containing protein n=1 Tax=Aurantiacibacter sp. D1-12 TaxID=2993658 RepID=UPI00237C5ABB|nr:EI24 domain-containing protein [Aurantiacibacter sp. D1-12]MDE1468074.1 EI24 domain-containing protein [Aurantiacibacter sp. D1-12]